VTDVRDNRDRLRYEIFDDGGAPVGFAQYVRRGGRVIFTHTEIDERSEGEGFGSRLAAGALDDVRTRGLRVVPLCPFIAAYIERHQQYDDLVDHAALDALSD
jgi:predicted GNAT family acetyltransferase